MANTNTITINIDAEVLQKLKKLAEAQKRKKGFLGKTISEATKQYLKEKEQEEIVERQLLILKTGFHMGKNIIKHRSELYDRR